MSMWAIYRGDRRFISANKETDFLSSAISLFKETADGIRNGECRKLAIVINQCLSKLTHCPCFSARQERDR